MKADIIIKGNAVFTGLTDQPEALAIAIKDNKILKVDHYDQLATLCSDQTKIIDAGNNTVMYGFHDAHMHLIHGVLFSDYAIPLGDCRSLKEIQALLEKNHDLCLTGEWLIGNGWDHISWGHTEYPTRDDIDAIIADRPVLLIHTEGHYAWVNSKALEIANITRDTLEPDFGIIVKDNQGEPTGMLIESAVALVGEYAYNFSIETKREMVKKFQQHALSQGVTSVNEFYMSRAHEHLVAYDVYEELDKTDQLDMRIHVWPPLNGDLETPKAMKERFTSSKLKVGGLKQFIDGVVTGHTALMVDDYKDQPGNRGTMGYTVEQFQKWVTEADTEGFQIRFHSIGDGAVRLGLDLYEEAQKVNGRRDSRHSLEHIEVVDEADIPRFKALGVQASLQPTHMALMPQEAYHTTVTDQKHDYIFLNKTFFDQGLHVPYASDYPIEILSPFLGLYHATTRFDYTNKERWNESEKISLATALQAYTLNSAYSTFREDELGTIEAGKFADIIILDHDLFSVTPDELKKTGVKITIVDGKIVYQR